MIDKRFGGLDARAGNNDRVLKWLMISLDPMTVWYTTVDILFSLWNGQGRPWNEYGISCQMKLIAILMGRSINNVVWNSIDGIIILRENYLYFVRFERCTDREERILRNRKKEGEEKSGSRRKENNKRKIEEGARTKDEPTRISSWTSDHGFSMVARLFCFHSSLATRRVHGALVALVNAGQCIAFRVT